MFWNVSFIFKETYSETKCVLKKASHENEHWKPSLDNGKHIIGSDVQILSGLIKNKKNKK